jgi:spermidine/putrescine transport system permease protein
MSEKKPSLWLQIYSVLVYGFIYAPILILIIFSFNTQKLNIRWEGFTLHWYEVLFNDGQILQATRNTIIIAIVSTLVATIIGTMAALAMQRYRFPFYNISETLMYIPIVIPEVVMGISLLVFFVMIKFTLGLTTITLSHIAFNVPFVALVVRARLHGYDTTFRRVTLPTIMPGVLSGAMLALTLSLDDYVITYFTAGPGSTTLPLRVYSMVRFIVTPEINALSTIWVLIIFIILVLGQIAQSKRT